MILHIIKPRGGSSRICSEAQQSQGQMLLFHLAIFSLVALCVKDYHGFQMTSTTLSHRVRTRGARWKGCLLLTSEVLLENLIFPVTFSILPFFLYWLELVTCQLLIGHWERRHRIANQLWQIFWALELDLPSLRSGSLPTASIKTGSVFRK